MSSSSSGSKQLLCIPLKGSVPIRTHLVAAIRLLISDRYVDTHPDAFVHDIDTLSELRDRVATLDVHQSSIAVASSYYAHLAFLSAKFPQHISISLPWYTSFPTSLPPLASHGPSVEPQGDSSIICKPYAKINSNGRVTVAQPDLVYERASVLFHLASLHSALGTSESRSGAESIKRAIAAFQITAGILSHIASTFSSQLQNLSPPRCPDLHPCMVDTLHNLMLAQAQECFWQKGVVDSLKDATIAKLAMRTSDLYAAALESAAQGVAGGQGDGVCELPSAWINHMTVKRWHFAAAAQFRKSCEDLGANRYGDELGRLQLADTYVQNALKCSKRGVSSLLLDDLDSLKKIISANLARGTKDNDLIYLESITPASSLSKIVPAEMAKPILPTEISQPVLHLRDSPPPAFGKPLFQELVPYSVHVAISIYDDRKETLLRDTIKSKRDELDSIATCTLRSLNLPVALQAMEQPIGLPSSLLRKSEEVHTSGGIGRLLQLLEDVKKVASADAAILAEASAHLNAEAAETAASRERLQQSNPQGYEEALQTAHALRDKLEEFEQTLRAASKSDEVVRTKFNDWREVMNVLDIGGKDLEDFIPQHIGSDSLLADTTDAIVQTQTQAARALQSALESLDDIFDSRATCYEEAKELVASDDIRPLALREAARLTSTLQEQGNDAAEAAVALEPRHFEEFFAVELGKFEHFEEELDNSERAQNDLLEEIKDLNEDFIHSRSVDPILKRREAALQMLDVGHAKFREIAGNLEEGLKFYNTLARLLGDLRRDIKEWHTARSLDVAQSAFEQQSLGDSAMFTAPSEVPVRRTRAQHRAQAAADASVGSDVAVTSSVPQQAQAPQWGQWTGGQIQFGE